MNPGTTPSYRNRLKGVTHVVSEKVTLPRGHGSRRRPPVWRRFGWADLYGPLAILSVVAVVCLWVMNQGVISVFSGFDRSLGSLGLLTGLVSADLMLVQVVLLARIPQVEQAWGHDLLAHRHRWVGFWSFWLMIAHVAAFAIERLMRAGSSAWARLWAVFVTDSWMLWATIGTIMVIAVTITSIRMARRKLRYESWHLLHLYAYLGIILVWPHMLADGSDFHQSYARVYWWTIYLISVATVLIWRVALPIWRSVYHRMRVTGVVTETPDVYSVHVRGHHLDKLRTKSGQFFIWRFMDGPGWTRGNPYTISAAPRDDQMRVTIQAAGDGSARVEHLKAGTRVLIEGPYGTMTAERRTQPRMLLIAAGVGITPMRAILEDSVYRPGEATLVYRYTTEEHAIFRDELIELSQRRGLELFLLPGRRRADDSWLPAGVNDVDDAEHLRRAVPDIAERDIFICGPAAWIASVRAACRKAGVHREQIHTEDYAW
jgi:predicted ferric reductase